MSHKCAYCGEITMTPNHVCEQATQKMIDEIKKMGDPGRNTGMADILRKNITDLAVDLQEKERENNQLRAELTAERKKVIHCQDCGADWYDDGWTADCPKCQVMDERKKREEAESKWEYYQEFVNHHRATSITDLVVQRDNLEAQVEVLREALKRIADWPVGSQQHIAKKTLANPPAEAEKVKAVLEATDYWYEKDEHEATDTQECLKEHPDCATCRLIEAVRERRGK